MADPFITEFDPPVGRPETLLPGLRRLVAPNASPMTFRGTNTYLLGEGPVAVIDPGPQDQTHLETILEAAGPAGISHILVTHSHVDHSPLSRPLAEATGAPVLAMGPSGAGRSAAMEALAQAGELGGGEGIDRAFVPDRRLAHGEIVEGQGWRIEALATPGHLGNHMCFAWGERVFTGDHVMSWATTMVSPPDGDLTDFMASLELLAAREDDRLYLPGHGAALEDPLAMVHYQIAHRRGREAQILGELAAAPATPAQLARRIYTDVAPGLLPAAERNVLAHLIDLYGKEIVGCEGPLARNAVYYLR
ncbi:MBL fold metallo-hydrolase [Maritimibacter sp. 55A14]|uniref:MBL fold metallo-hydrolase n=1 Tax=Maritimibacter sp. 55A14 TaxID=2174844 RepID=UPI000D61F3E4|nr:MBL fold metallo-hydrolase [Maritimibacter sp. 55A14]PWE34144.1 MBL fold metallo-hydrolase [Maritimibacter sp. 55A14]